MVNDAEGVGDNAERVQKGSIVTLGKRPVDSQGRGGLVEAKAFV